jgi:hypothetical protein
MLETVFWRSSQGKRVPGFCWDRQEASSRFNEWSWRDTSVILKKPKRSEDMEA